MRPTALAFVALGSNVGDRLATLREGVRRLGGLDATELVATSGVYETSAVCDDPSIAGGDYLNAAVGLRTGLEPLALLSALLGIERSLGRERAPGARWGARTLDLDLLLYADRVIEEDGLRVPHPRLGERAFVLAPLSEIAGDTPVPATGRTVAGLYAQTDRESREVLLRRLDDGLEF